MLYDDIIEELTADDCFVFSKKEDRYFSRKSVFFIRGTRFLCNIRESTNYGNTFSGKPKNLAVTIEWFFKTSKSKGKYKFVQFEEILESSLVSKKAKSKILFHLDIFRS